MNEFIYRAGEGDVKIAVRPAKGRDALNRARVLANLRSTANGSQDVSSEDVDFTAQFARIFTQTVTVKGLGDLDIVRYGSPELLGSAEEMRRLYETWLDTTDESLIYRWSSACYAADNPDMDTALAPQPPSEEVKTAASRGDKSAKNF